MSDRVIYKYEVRPTANSTVELPKGKGAEILSLAVQDDTVVFWAAVDPFADSLERVITVVPTGFDVPTCDDYVGTFQLDSYVGHVYIRQERFS